VENTFFGTRLAQGKNQNKNTSSELTWENDPTNHDARNFPFR
jgi:hypothetical protein